MYVCIALIFASKLYKTKVSLFEISSVLQSLKDCYRSYEPFFCFEIAIILLKASLLYDGNFFLSNIQAEISLRSK